MTSLSVRRDGTAELDMDWILPWFGLRRDFQGTLWTILDWIGLGWVGLGCTGLHWVRIFREIYDWIGLGRLNVTSLLIDNN